MFLRGAEKSAKFGKYASENLGPEKPDKDGTGAEHYPRKAIPKHLRTVGCHLKNDKWLAKIYHAKRSSAAPLIARNFSTKADVVIGIVWVPVVDVDLAVLTIEIHIRNIAVRSPFCISPSVSPKIFSKIFCVPLGAL